MSTSLVVNGVSYLYPDTGDQSWGAVASSWAAAVTTGMLQKAGGTFTLTADANFGANFGLLSKYYTSITANASSTGFVRLASADTLSFRNNANSADIALAKNASDQLTWAGTAFLSAAGVLLAAGFPALTGDVTTSAGSLATTVAKIAGVAVGTPTGTGNVVFSASPTFTGTIAAGAITLSTALTVANGGTGLAAGTSGGIPYFSSTSAMTSSALLAQFGVMLGGGTGAAPATLAPNASTAFPLVSGGAAANPLWALLTVAGGGTGLASGTSGGILGFTASGTLASSAALTVSQLIVGGGAGATPATLAAGSQYQVLTMGATTPGYGAVNLAQAAAVTGVLPNANTTGTAAATASTLALRDANANCSLNNLLEAYATTATAAGTTTLTVASAYNQYFTGSTTQTVVLPDATTLMLGHSFYIVNLSSGIVTVNKNGGTLVQSMAANSFMTVTVTNIGSAAGTWNPSYSVNNAGGGTVTSVTFTGDGTVLSSTPSSAVTTTGTLTATIKNQSANLVLSGPTSGAAAAPTFRALIPADMPKVIASKSSTYSVLASDDVLVASGASFTFTLPAANACTHPITFVHNDSNLARQYTIARAGSDTIGAGSTSTIIATQGESLTLIPDGTSNWILGSRTYPSSFGSLTWTPNNFGTIGTGGNAASYQCFRMGRMLRMVGRFVAGTLAGSIASIALPTGLTIDSTVLPGTYTGSGGTAAVGYFFGGTTSANQKVYQTSPAGVLFYDGADTANLYFSFNSGVGFAKDNASTIFNSNAGIMMEVLVPITGWN